MINLTDNALKRIDVLLEAKEPGTIMRLSVDSGGCSGFQYKWDFVQESSIDDLKISNNGKILLLIDPMSSPFLDGSVIDYVETLTESNFEIKNPNSKAGCGCGNSFSI